MNFGKLGNGNYTLAIQVSDVAGNGATQSIAFQVGDLVSAFGNPNTLSGLALQANILLNNSTNPAAISGLQTAILQLQAAAAIFTVDPGQAFLLGQSAYSSLSSARVGSNSAAILALQTSLAGVIEGEVSVILGAYLPSAANPPWVILDPNNSATGPTRARGEYLDRTFLTQQGGVFRDFIVNPNNVFQLATAQRALANSYARQGDLVNTIASSITAYDTLAQIYQDGVLYNLYGATDGYPANSVLMVTGNNVAPAYYNITHPNTFGDETGRIVQYQMQKFTQAVSGNPRMLAVLSPSTLATIQNANTTLVAFKNAVSTVQNANWAGFGNKQVVQNIYFERDPDVAIYSATAGRCNSQSLLAVRDGFDARQRRQFLVV